MNETTEPTDSSAYPPPDTDLPPIRICPILQAAHDTFIRDLPELLKTDADRWVAYRGSERLGIRKTLTDAEALASARGIPWSEILVWRIEPQLPIEFLLPPYRPPID